MRLKHQNLSLQYSLIRQRQMHSHLVTIKVSIERRTCQRVQLYSLTLNHLGLESLNTQTVQSRRTVQQDRVSLHHILQDIPNHRILAVYNLLSRLHRLDNTTLDELADNERFVQLGSHQFRQATLTHLQLRANNDDRTRRIIHTLTQQVLTETSLLTLQRVRERLQRTIVLSLHRIRATRVVKERIHRLLQHTLLIAENNLRSLNINQTLQTIVTNDHTAIQVVEIRCSETATVKRYERTELRRNDRQNLQNHPFRLVELAACTEALDHLQTLQRLILASLSTLIACHITQFVRQSIEVHTLQQIQYSLSTHLSDKLVRVIIIQIEILTWQTLLKSEILLLTQQVTLTHHTILDAEVILSLLRSERTRIEHHVTLIVDNAVELLGRHTQEVTNLVRQRAEIPDMRDRHYQRDMAATLASYLLLSHLHTTSVADDATIANALILTAMALIVLRRTKDALAKQTITLRLIRTIIDRLRFEDLTV